MNKQNIPLIIISILLLILCAQFVIVPWFQPEKKDKFKIKLPNVELEIDRPMDKIDE